MRGEASYTSKKVCDPSRGSFLFGWCDSDTKVWQRAKGRTNNIFFFSGRRFLVEERQWSLKRPNDAIHSFFLYSGMHFNDYVQQNARVTSRRAIFIIEDCSNFYLLTMGDTYVNDAYFSQMKFPLYRIQKIKKHVLYWQKWEFGLKFIWEIALFVLGGEMFFNYLLIQEECSGPSTLWGNS